MWSYKSKLMEKRTANHIAKETNLLDGVLPKKIYLSLLLRNSNGKEVARGIYNSKKTNGGQIYEYMGVFLKQKYISKIEREPYWVYNHGKWRYSKTKRDSYIANITPILSKYNKLNKKHIQLLNSFFSSYVIRQTVCASAKEGLSVEQSFILVLKRYLIDFAIAEHIKLNITQITDRINTKEKEEYLVVRKKSAKIIQKIFQDAEFDFVKLSLIFNMYEPRDKKDEINYKMFTLHYLHITNSFDLDSIISLGKIFFPDDELLKMVTIQRALNSKANNL